MEDDVMGEFLLAEFVDLDRYPIARSAGAEYAAMLREVRLMLAKDGCALSPAIWSGVADASGKTPHPRRRIGGLRFCVKRRF